MAEFQDLPGTAGSPWGKNPANFPGNPNPPPQIPAAPPSLGRPSTSTTFGGSSAGMGMLPPSTTSPASATPLAAPALDFTVGENGEGGHDAYAIDGENGPQRLFTLRLPGPDAQKVLEASGAPYNKALGLYEHVPEETIKALSQGRPTPTEYWKQQWDASEAEIVTGLNGLQYLKGEKSREQLLSANHLPTLKAQLANRPDMAWIGKGGILSGFLESPIDAAERGAESLGGTAIGAVAPLFEVAKKALTVGLGAGTAVGLVQPELAMPAFTVGATVGTFNAIQNMSQGQLAADWVAKGIPDDVIKLWAPVGGGVNAAMIVGGYKAMSMLGKAAFLDGLAESPAAQRVLAHWIAGAAEGGGVMAAQSAVSSFLNNVVAAVAQRPDLHETPEKAAFDALEAGLKWGLLGAGAAGVGGMLGEGLKALTPEELSTPEGKKVAASVQRAQEGEKPLSGRAVEGVEKHLTMPTEGPTPLTEPSEGGVQKPTRPVSGQSPEQMRGSSPEQIPGVSEQPAPEKPTGETPEGAATENNLSSGKSIAPPEPPGKGPPPPRGNGPSAEGPGDYVSERHFGVFPEGNPKAAAKEALRQYSEIYHGFLVRGAQLHDELTAEIPQEQRPGVRWHIASDGDKDLLRTWLKDEKAASVHDEIKTALDLPTKTLDSVKKIEKFYKEWRIVGESLGIIKEGVENYQDRVYAPDVKGERAKGVDWLSPFRQTTSHAKPRIFPNEIDAVRAGKSFAVDAIDALGLYNEEMSAVASNRGLANGLVDQRMAKWALEPPESPYRLVPIGENLEKQIGTVLKNGEHAIIRYRLYGPEELAKGLKPITEPDWTKKIPMLKALGRAQGTIKTGFLSWSGFHPIALELQAAGSGNWRALWDQRHMSEILKTPEFAANEKLAVDAGVLTSEIQANQDILINLTAKEGPLAKLANTPGLKQFLNRTEKNTEWIFGKQQRFLKVTDFVRARSDWMEANTDAAPETLKAAERQIADFVNPLYGGLNWTAMGLTKTTLSAARLTFLAPDWFTSAGVMGKLALTESGLSGSLARGYFFRSAILALSATELSSALLSGHLSTENKKGHEFETEIAPHVYFSFFRGPAGEALKLGSMLVESGKTPGAIRYGASKMAPFPRTIMGALENVQYSGRPIAPKNDTVLGGYYDYVRWILSQITPTPLGISGLHEYLKHEKDPTILGTIAVATGIGRYSPGGGGSDIEPQQGHNSIPK